VTHWVVRLLAIIALVMATDTPVLFAGTDAQDSQRGSSWGEATGRVSWDEATGRVSWDEATGRDLSARPVRSAAITKRLVERVVEEIILHGGGELVKFFYEIVVGYCAASWEGEWLRLCERHNAHISDLHAESRMKFQQIMDKYASEVPGSARNRCFKIRNSKCAWNGSTKCKANTPGHVPTYDRDCVNRLVSQERTQAITDLNAEHRSKWNSMRSTFKEECNALARRFPLRVPQKVPWSCAL